MADCIFGYQVRKQNFPTFHICILFWYFCKILFSRDLATEKFNHCISIIPHNTSFEWEFPIKLTKKEYIKEYINKVGKNTEELLCPRKEQKTILLCDQNFGGPPEIL